MYTNTKWNIKKQSELYGNIQKYKIKSLYDNILESTGLDAYKAGKIRPTIPGLADCKDFGKACNMMLGITNPHIHELPEYLGYDITKLKGNARFVEIVVNRDKRQYLYYIRK